MIDCPICGAYAIRESKGVLICTTCGFKVEEVRIRPEDFVEFLGANIELKDILLKICRGVKNGTANT